MAEAFDRTSRINVTRDVDPFAPPAHRRLHAGSPKLTIARIQVRVPIEADLEYRWLYGDGTRSPWTPVRKGEALTAPPAAVGSLWRKPGTGPKKAKTGAKKRGPRNRPAGKPALTVL
jgi:hypothetical protein